MSKKRDLVIGIDCSTTACKAIVWDRHGNTIGEGRAPLSLLMPRAAWHEQDAESWWLATGQAIRQAIAGVDVGRLAGLCIAHQRETFALVDEAGRPLRNAIVWMDERARSVLPSLDRLFGGERIHRLTGKPLSGNLSLAKLAWLAENEPHMLRRTFKVVDVHAFLIRRLTGRFRTGWGCADPMGLFDMPGKRWATDLLACIGLGPAHMPEVFPPGDVIGEVTDEAALQCGLPAGLPVVAGLGDGQAAGLGVNITQPGTAYLNLGTAVVSGAYSARYVVDRAFRTMYGGVPGSFSLETVILGGTYTVSWFVRQFGGHEEAWDAACGEVPPGSLGLLLVPYWNSAMNPYWDAAASGIVVGWRGIHGKTHLYRAVLEGIAYEQRLHTSGVEAALGETVHRYIVMGGGARSSRWCQIIADVTGKVVQQSAIGEAAALGAGMLAAAGIHMYSSVPEAAAAMSHNEGQQFKPDDRHHDMYTRVYEDVYVHLFPSLQPYLRRLTEIAES